ncbi:MAG TPA: hypothetical protein VL285_01950 [Bryobacteraceae bacterium]|nr:hypothetical protein [Bryobacteraceae bacterium]
MPRRQILSSGLLAVAFWVYPVWAQSKLSVDQLMAFVKSSIQLKHPDKQVAGYLLKLKLSQRLDARTIEELQGLGAGPATMEALRKLVETSGSLPSPPPPIVKVPPPPIPPPPIGEQKALLERVRAYALNYSKGLPNFICTQVTRRYSDRGGTGFWQTEDTLTTRLSYFEQKEKYELVMINNHATTQSYHSLGGASSSGEFGSMLQQIFDRDTAATFTWTRWATLRGKRAHVFTYHVPQPTSQWRISYERTQDIIVGYSGLIYVDRDTEMILKVTLDGEIPPTFPIQQAATSLDYDYTRIGDQTHLLPLKAEVRMRHDRLLTRNIVEFHLYRKFGADTSITFETPEALPDEKTKEEPPK